MGLVFSCIASHTPLLIPTIGKDNFKMLEKTEKAMQKLEQELYTTNPDTLIVISPHGDSLPDALTINFNSKYVSDFREFGDLTTKLEWKPNIMLVNKIREDFKEKNQPLVLASDESLDYGTSVALCYLTQHMPDIKIVPLITSGLDMEAHFNFGKALKDEILASTDRVAVIASAELSQTLAKDAPGGFSQRGVDFDEKIMALTESQNNAGILEIDEEWTSEAQACGAKVLGVLFGLLDGIQYKSKVLSYEKPFGVGYLVAEIHSH